MISKEPVRRRNCAAFFNPKFLIAMHPTRGLDVGAIEYIHGEIMKQRDEGAAVLLVSTELEEVMKLSDRIGVLFEGKLMGIVRPAETTVEDIGLMMGGMRLEQLRKPQTEEAPEKKE